MKMRRMTMTDDEWDEHVWLTQRRIEWLKYWSERS